MMDMKGFAAYARLKSQLFAISSAALSSLSPSVCIAWLAFWRMVCGQFRLCVPHLQDMSISAATPPMIAVMAAITPTAVQEHFFILITVAFAFGKSFLSLKFEAEI